MMAEIDDDEINKIIPKPKPPRKKKKKNNPSSCFLSCFGFSDTDQQYLPEQEILSPHHRKKVSWTRFRRKESVRRTVPVDNSSLIGGKIEVVKGERVGDNKVLIVNNNNNKCQIPVSLDREEDVIREIEEVVVSDRNSNQKIQKAKCENAQNSISEPCPPKTNMYKKQLSLGGRIKETKDGNHPAGSAVNKSGPRSTIISHSKSFPLHGRSKSAGHSFKQAQHVGQKSTRENGHSQLVGQKSGEVTLGKFGPVMGMSVLVVTLGIMLLWGRVCAVVFTSVWIYFVRYFRLVVLESSDETIEKISKSCDDQYFDSKEYKKKVILEGLLDRKH